MNPRFSTLGISIVTWLFVAAVLFPVYWMIVTAVQPEAISQHYPPPLMPQQPTLDAFSAVFERTRAGIWLLNSAIVASLTAAICVALASLGGFLLSGLSWRGQRPMGLVLLFVQMLPEALVVIPLYGIYNALGLINQLPGLALVDAAFVLPVSIWILRQTFDRISRDIRDAALVDGCGHLGTLFRIFIPLSLPGIAAVGTIAFFYAWNEYLFASTFMTKEAGWPASVGLASFRTQYETPVDQIFAGSVIFAALPLALFLWTQRYLVSGLTAGAVKG